ncbi:Carnitine O-acetyltransferase mitochondrial [Tulasnella sp. 424]|nr:Carnitine O-acetyltransferase mitochondrial [Tulasnella sp. 424]KAG8966230.1 Carnitine O-acetyltransferase mitochondrial [Tulasnella sp. 425]
MSLVSSLRSRSLITGSKLWSQAFHRTLSISHHLRLNKDLIQNSKRPENWKDAAPFPPANTVTFASQESLPKLPLPELNITLSTLRTSLKGLAWSDNEINEVEGKIRGFEKEGGMGRTLHGRLTARRNDINVKHWLEDFWDDTAYLKYRDPVMINVSYYCHLPQTAVSRAAYLIRAALLERRAYKQGTMLPEINRNDSICMDTWRWMFDCCRIPGLEGTDWSVTGAKPSDTGNEGHIIVLRRNRPWKMEVSKDGRLLSVAEIERQIEHIYENTADEGPEVGVLTSNNRDTWAKDYASLAAADRQNATNLEDIVTAAFVVCLDTARPANPLELSRLAFHGGVNGEMLGNRWWDKPAQIVICDNAEAAYVGEHSAMDGTPSVTMLDRMLSAIKRPDFDHGNTEDQIDTLAPPSRLEWKTPSSIQNAIASARKAAQENLRKQAMGMTSTSYGRDAIKKFGFSPDAWTQMLIQLAYHRLIASTLPHKNGRRRDGGTYEAASTRGFLKGRTETIRAVTEESMAWCDSMDDPNASEEERIRLFKVATKKQGEDVVKAVKAMGIDRHLFGLQNMLKLGEDIPELFKDPLFVRAKTWIVSTSVIFSSHFTRGYGWGQVVPNGFGVAYMTGFSDELKFTVTSLNDQPNAQFVEELVKAAEDLKRLFESQDNSLKSLM